MHLINCIRENVTTTVHIYISYPTEYLQSIYRDTISTIYNLLYVIYSRHDHNADDGNGPFLKLSF